MSTEGHQTKENPKGVLEFLNELDEAPPPTSTGSTVYSILDMELTEDLCQLPLSPQPSLVPPAQSQATSGVQSQVLDLHSKMEDVKSSVKGEMDIMKTTLAELLKEKQREGMKHMDSQLEYMLTQIKATVGWRLKHHHSEMLQEFQTLLAPVTASMSCLQDEVTRLQGELSHYTSSVKSMSEELAAKVQSSQTIIMDQTSQTTYQDIPHTVTLTHRPRMESTARPGNPGFQAVAPGYSLLPGEV